MARTRGHDFPSRVDTEVDERLERCEMSQDKAGPQIDRETAESMEEDADFAGEHSRPTYADEPSTEEADESVPGEDAGGMDVEERRRPD